MLLQDLMEADRQDTKMFQALQQQFPEMKMMTGEEWGAENVAAVAGDSSEIKISMQNPDDPEETMMIPAFDNYDDEEAVYVSGVARELNDFVEKNGYYWEAYDAGTWHLAKQ